MTRHDMTWLLQWSKEIGRKFIEKTKDQKWIPKPSQCSENKTWPCNHLSQTGKEKGKIWAECTPYLQRMQAELNFTTLSLSLIGMYILILVITLIRKTLACSYSFNLFASALRHLYKFLPKNKLIAFNGLHLWTQVFRVSYVMSSSLSLLFRVIHFVL